MPATGVSWPASVPRAEILKLLVQRGFPIKLWEPDAQGLGRQWALQGWVFWRWRPQGAELQKETGAAGGDEHVDLCWVDVSAAQYDGSFTLAESIITAAARNAREKK